MSQYFGKLIKNKAGVIQVDKFGKPLHIGQKVIYMVSSNYKGRGDIGNGVIVSFDRYIKIIKGDKMDDDNFVRHIIETINSDTYKKSREPKWEKERNIGLDYGTQDDISSQFLIGVSDYFMRGWQDGSIRE